MAHKHALKRFHFYQPTSRKQPFWTMLNPTGSGNQSEYQKQFDVKLPRWFYVEFWNRVEWAAISETGCTKQSSVVALTLHAAHFWTFSKRNACWHRRRNRLKEAVGVDEASCDTWRCLVHPVPLIITRDTRFLNSKWIPRGFSTPMPDFPSFILIPSTCWTKHGRTRHVSTRLVFFKLPYRAQTPIWYIIIRCELWYIIIRCEQGQKNTTQLGTIRSYTFQKRGSFTGYFSKGFNVPSSMCAAVLPTTGPLYWQTARKCKLCYASSHVPKIVGPCSGVLRHQLRMNCWSFG